MNILQGIKTKTIAGSTKQFIIKPKLNLGLKQNKQTIDSCTQISQVTCSPKQIQQFLIYMIQKSKRFQQLMASKSILNENQFTQKHLFNSTCIKTILKSVLDKMIVDKRLGRNLKGMNKSNMIQIQNHLWSTIQREVALYINQRKYVRERDQLKRDLLQRKKQLANQLQNVNKRFSNYNLLNNHIDHENNEENAQAPVRNKSLHSNSSKQIENEESFDELMNQEKINSITSLENEILLDRMADLNVK